MEYHISPDLRGRSQRYLPDGVGKIKKALNPLTANGSGIKQLFFMSLPEKA